MTHTAPTTDLDPSLGEYQSLSPLAALALLLGLLAPAALVTPMLLIVPAAAIGVGLLALAKIHGSAGALTGERLAQWGVALALAATVATLVREPVRDRLLRRQVADAAAQWFNILADGRVEDALDLLSGGAISALGPRPSPDAEPPTAEQVHAMALANLEQEKLVERLAAFKAPLRITPEAIPGADPEFDSGRTIVRSNFAIRSAEGDESLRAELRLARNDDGEPGIQPWRIEYWRLVE